METPKLNNQGNKEVADFKGRHNLQSNGEFELILAESPNLNNSNAKKPTVKFTLKVNSSQKDELPVSLKFNDNDRAFNFFSEIPPEIETGDFEHFDEELGEFYVPEHIIDSVLEYYPDEELYPKDIFKGKGLGAINSGISELTDAGNLRGLEMPGFKTGKFFEFNSLGALKKYISKNKDFSGEAELKNGKIFLTGLKETKLNINGKNEGKFEIENMGELKSILADSDNMNAEIIFAKGKIYLANKAVSSGRETIIRANKIAASENEGLSGESNLADEFPGLFKKSNTVAKTGEHVNPEEKVPCKNEMPAPVGKLDFVEADATNLSGLKKLIDMKNENNFNLKFSGNDVFFSSHSGESTGKLELTGAKYPAMNREIVKELKTMINDALNPEFGEKMNLIAESKNLSVSFIKNESRLSLGFKNKAGANKSEKAALVEKIISLLPEEERAGLKLEVAFHKDSGGEETETGKKYKASDFMRDSPREMFDKLSSRFFFENNSEQKGGENSLSSSGNEIFGGNFRQSGENSFDMKELFSRIHNSAKMNLQKNDVTGKTEVKSKMPELPTFYNVRPEEIGGKIVNLTTKSNGIQNTSARLLLTPKSLGTVFVEIQMSGESMKLNFKADKPEAVKTIEKQIVFLKEKIQNIGLRMESVEVGLNEYSPKEQTAGERQGKSGQRQDEESVAGGESRDEMKDGTDTEIPREGDNIRTRLKEGVYIEKYI